MEMLEEAHRQALALLRVVAFVDISNGRQQPHGVASQVAFDDQERGLKPPPIQP